MVLAWAIFYMIESFKAFNGSGLPWLGNIASLILFIMTSSIIGCDNWWSSGKDCYIPEVANYTTECHPYVNFTETINGRKRYDIFSNYVIEFNYDYVITSAILAPRTFVSGSKTNSSRNILGKSRSWCH